MADSRARLKAQFDFQARVPNELSFKEGDIILLIDKHESGMWKGELDGQIGLFPYNFVAELDGADVCHLSQNPLLHHSCRYFLSTEITSLVVRLRHIQGASGTSQTPALTEGWLTKQGFFSASPVCLHLRFSGYRTLHEKLETSVVCLEGSGSLLL
jgi:hypothetical protein